MAQLNSKEVIGTVVGLTIAIYVAASLLPDALGSWFSANTTGWSDGAVTLWEVTGLIVVLVFTAVVLGMALDRL